MSTVRITFTPPTDLTPRVTIIKALREFYGPTKLNLKDANDIIKAGVHDCDSGNAYVVCNILRDSTTNVAVLGNPHDDRTMALSRLYTSYKVIEDRMVTKFAHKMADLLDWMNQPSK